MIKVYVLCPAFSSECCKRHKVRYKSKGQGKGHSTKENFQRKSNKVHMLENEMANDSPLTQLYFHTITNDMNNSTGTQALINLHIDSGQMGKNIACKIGTDAEGNIIPLDTYMQLHPHGSYDADGRPLDLIPSSTNITAFGGHVIKQYGTCLLTLTLNSSTKHSFHVVDRTGPTILGLPTCRDMKLITLSYTVTTPSTSAPILIPSTSNNIQGAKPAFMPRCSTPQNSNEDPKSALLRDYPGCFNGCFSGDFHITLDPNVPPVIQPPGRAPEALRGLLKKELDNLESQGIISKVSDPTDWVNSLVCVTKPDGTLRLWLDTKYLNKAIKRPHHCIPTIDEILPKLNGSKVLFYCRCSKWLLEHKA